MSCSYLLLLILFVLFEPFVQDTHPFDTIFSLLLSGKLKAHFDFLIILSFVRKLIWNLRILIVAVKYSMLITIFILRIRDGQLMFKILVVILVILAKPRNTEVECYDLGATLSARDFNQVVHEES